jgi:aspartyl-tRNA(Asn)/glutamyl-tRNA(Gln) amidotransferase subunit A
MAFSGDELASLLAGDIAARVGRGEVSAEAVVRAALARAERVQQSCNAFITIAADAALGRARALDAARAAGEALGPLAGVPVVVKDNLCTAGVRTTAGSKSLEAFVPPYSATVVERLEAAGAILIAKTNLDEFGMGGSSEHSAFGPTRNPWNPERVPGGSSGGSAVAVAAGVAPIALGTDTGGSVRQPAALTGLIGFKPTYGRLSRYGVVSYASSLDQVGVFCRSTRDLALALEAMGGHDPRDATSLDAPFQTALPEADPAALTVGVVTELSGEGNSPGVRAALGEVRERLERLGAAVVPVSLPLVRYGVAAYYLVAPAEASSNLARYDGMIYSRRTAQNRVGQAEAMMRSRGETLGPEVRRRVLMGSYALSAGYYDAFYGKALKVRRRIADEMLAAFGRVDLLMTPTAPAVAYPLGSKLADPLSMYLDDASTVLANLTGTPAVSLPAGLAEDGLPCGVQFLAPPLQDERLLALARALEPAGGAPIAPLAPAWERVES